MFVHDVAVGRAVLHLYTDDCRNLARLLDDLPDHGGEDRMELVEALSTLFRGLAAATHAHGFIRERDQAGASLQAVQLAHDRPEQTANWHPYPSRPWLRLGGGVLTRACLCHHRHAWCLEGHHLLHARRLLALLNFGAHDPHVCRRLNANPHLAPVNPEDGHDDLLADQDALFFLPTDHKHRAPFCVTAAGAPAP